MATKTERFEGYLLPVLRQPKAPIDNLVFDDLGKAVLEIHNKIFMGVKRIEDTTEYNRGQPISFSNTPRALSYNQILIKLTNGRIRVLSPEEVVRYWDSIPERDTTYADTNNVSVFPNQGPNEDLRQRVINITGKNGKRLKVPLVISGLGVEKADNKYGFTFTETDYTKTKEAPFLIEIEDGKVAYNPKKDSLVSSKEGVSILVPSEQSGLRVLSRYRDWDLVAWYEDLVDSDADGRVQVIQEPKARKKL